MANIVSCVQCGARNRLSAGGATEIPQCGRCGAALPWIVNAGDASFDQEADVPVPALVDLWAPWCGPCRAVAPVLEDLSRELAGRLKVIKINVDDNPRLAARFEARSIPTLVLFQGGEVRERVIGAQPKAKLRSLVDAYIPSEDKTA
ncbi:MAG: thioredoxin [Acidobacteriota bacterium]